MILRSKKRGLLLRLLVAAVVVGLSGVAVSPAAQAAPRPGALACYEGRIPGSSNWDGDISTHVHGHACTTRWARLVWDDNPSCCVPLWVKIDRQEYGSYGWLTTHSKSKKVLWGAFGTHNTATVPWRQYSDQRFHACWAFGTSLPNSWDCGPWVN
jgi:hypothetical protein